MTVYRPSVQIGGAFSLVDHFGQPVDETSFLGRHTLIFFGFTHCRRICPEALSRLSRSLALMGPAAERVRPLYISIDPARDTPERMREFLEASYPRFLGLTGDKAQVEQMKTLYKVYAEEQEPTEDGGYDVPHTAMAFVMGPDGQYVTHFGEATPAETIAARLSAILGASAAP